MHMHMIPTCRDEISARLTGTDFTLRLHGGIKFIPVFFRNFSGICLEMFTFSFNFPLQPRVKLLFSPA